jgi:hypothetical protein
MILILLFGFPGCAHWAEPTGALAAADVASVVVFGRGIADIGVSAISGRDCSIVRLDRGLTYCAPIEPPPDPGPFCTRSLGTVDCWINPQALPTPQQPVADGPAPTLAQEQYRHARWPKSLTAGF